MISDPGRPMRPRPIAGRLRGPRDGNDEGANEVTLSRLNSMAFGLAAYVSRDGFPPDRARRASGCLVKLSRTGFDPQGSDKRFLTHVMCVVLLFQASWHNPVFVRFWAWFILLGYRVTLFRPPRPTFSVISDYATRSCVIIGRHGWSKKCYLGMNQAQKRTESGQNLIELVSSLIVK